MRPGAPDAGEAIRRYRDHAAGYDASALRTLALRYRAIGALALSPGDAVIDVACGTGLSFPVIEAEIGPSGRLCGIEVSPDMAALAHRRVDRAGWANVTLVVDRVEAAALPAASFDAALFNFTHDVLQSAAAIERVLAALKPGARVALAGSKLLPWWAAPLNAWVRWNNAAYMTTFAGLGAPWRLIAPQLEDFRWAPALFGAAYVGSGRYRRAAGTGPTA